MVKEGLNSERLVSCWIRTLKSILLHYKIVLALIVIVRLASATTLSDSPERPNLAIIAEFNVRSVVSVLLKDISPLLLKFDSD